MTEHALPSPAQREPEPGEDRFRAVQERSLDGLAIVRSLRDAAGRVIDFTGEHLNPVAERLAGRPLAELRGRRMTEVFPGAATNGLLERFLRVHETGEPQVFEQHYDADGISAWYRNMVIRLDDGLAIVFSDISAQKQAELERARLLAFTTALAAALTPAQVAEIIFANVHKALGAQSGMVVLRSEDGRSLDLLAAMGDPQEGSEHWQRLAIELPLPLSEAARSGQPVWVESPEEIAARFPRVREILPGAGACAALPLTISQRVIGVLGVSFAGPRAFPEDDRVHLQVIAQQCALALERAWLYESERRAHLAAEQAVRTRDDLLVLVSHDLRNPLTVILGQAQLIVKQAARFGEAVPELGPRLTMIRDMVTQIDGQIDELLDVARLHSGQALALNREPTDLVAVVRASVLAAQATSGKHQIGLTAPDGALLLLGDQRRLGRVFANLLRNAIIYSPTGGPISVAVTRVSDDAGTWGVVSVADTGIGIPAADLPLVFERFYRGANVAGRIRGTGLGLASARQIVEQHEGHIAVTSVEGAGSTFTISLPCPGPEED